MIPLLSVRGLSEFTASEFKNYVRSLYHKPTPKKSAPKRKKERDKAVSAKITKKGKVSVVTARRPKYITEGEMGELARSLGRGENDIFIAAKEKEIAVYPTHEVAEEIKKKVDEIPW